VIERTFAWLSRYRRTVRDYERLALRTHLGLDRLDLLGHSAAGNTATLYAARHPHHLDRLILLTPGLRAVGIELTEDEWLAAIRRRSGEPWYADAYAALMAWDAGEDTPHNRGKAAPLFYGRWDDEIAAHAASTVEQRAPEAAVHFAADGAFDPERTRAALMEVTAPVLVYAGELDPAPTPRRAGELAALFPTRRPGRPARQTLIAIHKQALRWATATTTKATRSPSQ
jgi:proline iminopeptidase